MKTSFLYISKQLRNSRLTGRLFRNEFWVRLFFLILLNHITFISMAQVSFNKSNLGGISIIAPTSLQFGPDGKLYVAQADGLIKVYTIFRNSATNYTVSGTQTISLIQQIPNHNDDGTLNTAVNTRLVTGILVTGTAANPVLYVTSSDPRMGGKSGGTDGLDVNLDTNSGILSKLTWDGSKWVKIDLVRGLPRSEGDHVANGMQLDKVTNTLYLAMAGNTNMGAPSNNFAKLSEYALSAAILSINLTAIGNTTYDLPTLDDDDRLGTTDANDPFGGNNGKNQAIIVSGGPVQVYSPGWRNPYDLVLTQAGRLYAFDNGPNSGWGAPPISCSNALSEPGNSYPDNLHLITGKGFYAGHPNPTRANRSNTFNASNPQSPVPSGMQNPTECNYLIPGTQDGALATIPASTNGLVEYTASNFGNALKGNLLAVSFTGKVYRIILNATGTALVTNGLQELFTGFGTQSLDLTTQGDNAIFPGTIWVANYGSNTITVFEPINIAGCDLSNLAADADGDKYTNKDEQDNNTDPCSPASVPNDWDKDFVSDLNDTDDDNDGQPDTADKFALDPQNGKTTPLPQVYSWDNDGTAAGGFLNLGFTGLMTNGTTDYLKLFDAEQMTAVGAAGVLTVDNVPAGDAVGTTNNQQYGFQFGVNVMGQTAPYTLHTRIMGPFAGFTPKNYQAMGMFLGTGDQDNYLKITTAANNGAGGIEVLLEQAGKYVATMYNLPILGKSQVDLYLTINPTNFTVQPSYAIDGGVRQNLGAARVIPQAWLSQVLACGIISTSLSSNAPFPATWDFLEIKSDQASQPTPVARYNCGGAAFMASTGQFSADANFAPAPGFTYTNNNITDISGTTDDALYRSERASNTNVGSFGYNVPVSNGSYRVVLHFAEIYWGATGGKPTEGAAGKRVFNVSIEGAAKLANYDIFAEVGAMRATTKTFDVAVADGVLNINFTGVVDRPKVSAIEVLALGAVGNLSPVVSAGSNRTVTLPTDTLTLKGSASDPDGIISACQWSKLSGPSVNMVAANTPNLQLSGLLEGSYVFRLTVTDNAGATAAADVNVSVVKATTIVSLTLVNANTDQDIATLTNGYVINYTALGTQNVSVRATTSPATVGSVVFNLDNGILVKNENIAPYAFFGDGNSGKDFYPINPAMAIGQHTLTVTPYSAANGGGTKGTPVTVSFSVSNLAARMADTSMLTAVTQREKTGQAPLFKAYPNPFADKIWITYKPNTTAQTSIVVYNAQGQLIKVLFQGTVSTGELQKLELDGSNLPTGAYFCRLLTDGQAKTIRVLLAK